MEEDAVLDAEDVTLCREAFGRKDKKDKGNVCKKELTSLLRSMGHNPTDAEVHDMINEVDVDGSGVVEFEEFVTFIARLMKNMMDPENEVRECYRRFDPCNEGAIRVSELRFVMRNLPERLSEEELEELMAAADKDGDGLISFQEFRQMMGQ